MKPDPVEEVEWVPRHAAPHHLTDPLLAGKVLTAEQLAELRQRAGETLWFVPKFYGTEPGSIFVSEPRK